MPTHENKPAPLFEWSCCKRCFTLESTLTHLCCSTCRYVKQETPKKQHCAIGRTYKWRQTQFAVTVYASEWQRGIAESLHAYWTMTRLWGSRIFERSIRTLENMPAPLFEVPLKFIAHGICSRDYYMSLNHHIDKSGSGSSAENVFRPECIFHTNY